MSYKSLLFCPDEKAAQVVTQVLSELEFTVEIALETFATVKRLTDEHFDALVVDCHNEQDASLLFKAARNSAHNHSSLSVAVVEGQTGVAKAFRIGANLVLTKPINVEQSKSTLRVAKGLLRKNENRGSALASTPAPTTQLAWGEQNRGLTPSRPPSPPVAKRGTRISEESHLNPAVAPAPGIVSPEPHIAAAAVPYAGLEVENDPIPEPEAADLAMLESMPKVIGKTASEPTITALAAPPQPIAASTAGYGAAAAPALEKKPAELKLAGAAPMVTNEPIVRENAPDLEPAASVPSFSSLDATGTGESGGGKGFLRVALILAVVGVAGYFGWQKFQPSQYWHRSSTAAEPRQAAPDSAGSSTPAPVSASPNTSASASNGSDSAPSITLPDGATEPPAIPATPHQSSNSVPQEIEVQEMPITRDMKVPPPTKIQAAPTVQPLVVKPGSATKAAAAPPPPVIAAPSNSSADLSKLISADAPLPPPTPTTVRISQGVSQGLLLKKVPPVYPPMAVQLRKEGVVQLLATISKTGEISNVKVLSGDSMLARAAADAVLRWKYRPYLLNGNPVEIETQISIVFKTPQ
jgi:protein TonB